MDTEVSLEDAINQDEVIHFYKAINWLAASKPQTLINALRNSHTLVTARISGELVGIGHALSHNHLVVYHPHFQVTLIIKETA